MTRWNRRMLFGVLAVLVPALAGCEAGFNAPTLDFHPAAFGAYKTTNGISISNAFVLGPSLNGPAVAGGRAGVFLSITAENGDRLTSASAPGTALGAKIAGGSVNLPAQVPVNLTGPVPQVVLVALANPLEGGETVTLKLTFAEAGTVTMAVPVEPQAYEYSTFSPPPTPAPPAKKRANPSASASASGSATPTATATP